MSRPSRAFLRSGEVARLCGVSTDTLRHYESRGLLPGARRLPNGYREFPEDACGRVRLIRRAVTLGFTLEELSRILAVRERGGAPCRSVRTLAAAKLEQLERRLREMAEARDQLRAVLERWDALLSAAPPGSRVGLLEALEGVVVEGQPSPLLPAAWRRRPPAGP